MSLIGLEAKVLGNEEISDLRKELGISKVIVRAVRRRELYESCPEYSNPKSFSRDAYEFILRDNNGFYVSYNGSSLLHYPVEEIFGGEEQEESFFDVVKRNIIEGRNIENFEEYWKMRKKIYEKLWHLQNSMDQIDALKREPFNESIQRIFSTEVFMSSLKWGFISGLLGLYHKIAPATVIMGLIIPIVVSVTVKNPIYLINFVHKREYHNNLLEIHDILDKFVKDTGLYEHTKSIKKS